MYEFSILKQRVIELSDDNRKAQKKIDIPGLGEVFVPDSYPNPFYRSPMTYFIWSLPSKVLEMDQDFRDRIVKIATEHLSEPQKILCQAFADLVDEVIDDLRLDYDDIEQVLIALMDMNKAFKDGER